jgi:predicted AAA+ superfamily ATPase
MSIFWSALLALRALQLIFQRLLDAVNLDHYRFLYAQFSLEDRLTGLVGPRGVGKTTLLLQSLRINLRTNIRWKK